MSNLVPGKYKAKKIILVQLYEVSSSFSLHACKHEHCLHISNEGCWQIQTFLPFILCESRYFQDFREEETKRHADKKEGLKGEEVLFVLEWNVKRVQRSTAFWRRRRRGGTKGVLCKNHVPNQKMSSFQIIPTLTMLNFISLHRQNTGGR